MFKGSFTALITPFRDGAVDEAAFEAFVDWQIGEGSEGLVPCGTTGESPTLSHEEHREVIRFGVAHAGGRIPVMAGTGSNSTTEAIELTVAAAESGADSVLIVTPYYNRPTQEGMFQHFKAIASSINLPIVLYNVPSRTASDLSNETVLRLSQIENIVGLKDATGDVARARDLMAMLPEGFVIFSGDDATTCDLLAAGAHGCISVTANICPADMALMCKMALAGNLDDARRIDERLQPLHRDLFLEPNPVPVKYALGTMGLIDDFVRLPLTRLSAEHEETVKQAVAQCKS